VVRRQPAGINRRVAEPEMAVCRQREVDERIDDRQIRGRDLLPALDQDVAEQRRGGGIE
jgi:hypothetical protein